MNKNFSFVLLFLFLSSCTFLSKGSGQVVYHWEKTNTGVEKFSRDHAECLVEAKEFEGKRLLEKNARYSGNYQYQPLQSALAFFAAGVATGL